MPRVIGAPTRGTTAPNRLRRADRWLTGVHGTWLRSLPHAPLVVDLGFGATPVTTAELATRLGSVRPDVEVVGAEIDPARVAAASPLARPGLSFVRAGFELGPLDGRRVDVLRAFNVLRQYDESEVPAAWDLLQQHVARPDSSGGLVIDGTCDEIGRRATWVSLGAEGPRSLTLSWHLRGLQEPSEIAERLPKALIHRNVPGEGIHAWLRALDRAWWRAAPLASYGVRQRFVAAVAEVREQWPVLGGRARWRLGEVTVDWSAVAPGAPQARE